MKHALNGDKPDAYYYEMETEEQKQWKLKSEREARLDAARKQREEHWKELEAIRKLEEEYEEDPELEKEDEDNEYESFDYDDLHLAYSGEKSPKYVLRRLGSIFTSVYAAVQKLKKDSWKELQFSLVDNSKLNVTLEYKGGQLNTAPVLEVENFTNLKKRFMCHIIGIEPQFENIIKNCPFIPMVAGQRKPEGQWTADERKAELGWPLEEIHVTWAHLEKKRTRLRLYAIYLEELCIQSVETASRLLSDGVRIFKVTAS
ncbi:hypothetical protein Tco_1064735 [Tanacetum coccineum]